MTRQKLSGPQRTALHLMRVGVVLLPTTTRTANHGRTLAFAPNRERIEKAPLAKTVRALIARGDAELSKPSALYEGYHYVRPTPTP